MPRQSSSRAPSSNPMATPGRGPFPLSVWFGEAIRALREERGGTQEGMGYEEGGGRVVWEGIENGRGNPTLRTIGRMAVALDIDWMTLCRAVEAQRLKAVAAERLGHTPPPGAQRRPRRVRTGRPKSKPTPRTLR
jgi:transcriptional regulator with XRE-family HTH domain